MPIKAICFALLFLYLSAGAQKPDSIFIEWQDACEKGFPYLIHWISDEKDFTTDWGIEHQARISLANAYMFMKNDDLRQAKEKKIELDYLLSEYPQAMNPLLDNKCFSQRLDEIERYINNKIIFNATGAAKATIQSSVPPLEDPIQKLLPCAQSSVESEIMADGRVEFNIKIRDCKIADSSKKGYEVGKILPPGYFEIIYNWLSSQWLEYNIESASKMSNYFEVEIHGHADATDVTGTLEFPFGLEIPIGVSYLLLDHQSGTRMDKMVAQHISDIIPYSIESNELLALGRAWTPWQALSKITQKFPLLVSEVHNQIGGEYRGVDIKISSPLLFSALVNKNINKIPPFTKKRN